MAKLDLSENLLDPQIEDERWPARELSAEGPKPRPYRTLYARAGSGGVTYARRYELPTLSRLQHAREPEFLRAGPLEPPAPPPKQSNHVSGKIRYKITINPVYE